MRLRLLKRESDGVDHRVYCGFFQSNTLEQLAGARRELTKKSFLLF